jgi:hypothetical protein
MRKTARCWPPSSWASVVCRIPSPRIIMQKTGGNPLLHQRRITTVLVESGSSGDRGQSEITGDRPISNSPTNRRRRPQPDRSPAADQQTLLKVASPCSPSVRVPRPARNPTPEPG